MVVTMTSERRGYTIACPACDTAAVYERAGNGNATKHPDRPYCCQSCGTALLYVIERPMKNHAGKQSQLPGFSSKRRVLANEVQAMNPEDVGLSPVGVRGGSP